MNDKDNDIVVIRDRSSRRQFIRTGSAFLLGAATIPASSFAQQQRTDCDSSWNGEGEKKAGEGTDSDTGVGADRPGCGRGQAPLTQNGPAQPVDRTVKVAKIKA